MKKIVLAAAILSLSVAPAFADGNKKPVSEKVNEVNIFNKISDHLATIGKSDVQKAAILKKRKEARRLQRLKDQQKKQEKENERKIREIQEQNRNIKGWREGSYAP